MGAERRTTERAGPAGAGARRQETAGEMWQTGGTGMAPAECSLQVLSCEYPANFAGRVVAGLTLKNEIYVTFDRVACNR